MILYELTGTEDHVEYQRLAYDNLKRQLNFMQSMVVAAVNLDRPFLSQAIVKALNYQAIACLHVNAGEYRPCKVYVGTGDSQYVPPRHYRVSALMDDFINVVNMNWVEADQFYLSAYVLWKLNHIHPFINGNGRTARACCYFVLCVKAGGLILGNRLLPELLKVQNDRYVSALKQADELSMENLSLEEVLTPLTELIQEQLAVQLTSAVSE